MESKSVELTLGWPPTVNHYWLAKGKLRFLSSAAKEFRAEVQYISRLVCMADKIQIPLAGRLKLEIKAFPPDRRKRDLDNILKALLDSLTHAGIYCDDNQVDNLSIQRCAFDTPGGHVQIIITEL